MRGLILPRRLIIDLSVWSDGGPQPYRGGPIALSVQTFAREKGDHHLGPIFTDTQGHVELTKTTLESYVACAADSGLMPFAPIASAYPFIEIVHWSGEQIQNAIHARTHSWTQLLQGESALFGSIAKLLQVYRACDNHLFSELRLAPVRDEWDSPSEVRRYSYLLQRAAT